MTDLVPHPLPGRRLLSPGSVVVDLLIAVPRLPVRGGDVIAGSVTAHAGGAFNALAAAARLGLHAVHVGVLGTGPRADQADSELAAAGVDTGGRRHPALDTGQVLCLVEPDGERTFVTLPGAEATLTAADLAGVTARPGDFVLVSGYSLALATAAGGATALSAWVAGVPTEVTVCFDPGPLAGDLPTSVTAAVLARADWLTCNAGEARALTGEREAGAAATSLAARVAGGVVVRTGAAGAVLAHPGQPAVVVPAPAVTAVDTTGAGDAHTGALLAALAGGARPRSAVQTANAAAAWSVMRRGPATGPTTAELAAFVTRPG